MNALTGLTSSPTGISQQPEPLRQAAEAFEALFLNILLTSMRKTIPEGGMFDSQQMQAYQEMQDRELSKDLARRKSLGIAELIVRQLNPTAPAAAPSSLAPARSPANRGAPATVDEPATAGPAAADLKTRFIQRLLPAARRYAPKLGQPVSVLIAQAALETGWGRAVPRDAQGRSSHNVFGIKTGPVWKGARVRSATLEYQRNHAYRTSADFRAYRSPDESFADYVSLISNADRYRSARKAGDTDTYLHSLAAGGYATDPDYARKVLDILKDPALERIHAGLKKSTPRPSVQVSLTSEAGDAQ